VLTITLMVTVMVTAFSYLYNLTDTASADQQHLRKHLPPEPALAYFAANDLPDLSSTRVDTNDPAAVRRAPCRVSADGYEHLNSIESETYLWPYIYDISIVDANGKRWCTRANWWASRLLPAEFSQRHVGALPRATSPGIQTGGNL